MIDFHTHILPEMDDGSESVEESIQMLELSAQQGVKWMVATPHFYADREDPKTFLERRHEAHVRLEQGIGGREDLPKIMLGAEVRYYEGISQSKELQKLKIEDSNLLLLEMPFIPWSDRMLHELVLAQKQSGLQIVLAHIERYFSFQGWGFWKKLEQTGVLIQSNANFFIQNRTRKKAMHLMEKGRIQFLGSDCHNMTLRRPNMGEAAAVLTERFGNDALKWLEEQKSFLPINMKK